MLWSSNAREKDVAMVRGIGARSVTPPPSAHPQLDQQGKTLKCQELARIMMALRALWELTESLAAYRPRGNEVPKPCKALPPKKALKVQRLLPLLFSVQHSGL